MKGVAQDWTFKDGQPVDPLATPPPGPDSFLRATPDGNRVVVIDTRRPPPAAEPGPLPDRAERLRYHGEQARHAEQAKQWFAAFHLGRMLLDLPDDVEVKRR